MARTTVDIDTPILPEIKRLQRAEGKSLGRLVSDLLSEALAGRTRKPVVRELLWMAQDMRALVDIGDKDALHAALDNDAS